MKRMIILHIHEDHAHCFGEPDHPHDHPHVHSHEQTKSVMNRLARAAGHLDAVRRMVEDGRDCTEILMQLAAVRSALNNTAKVILKDHIEHCIVDAVAHNDTEALDDLNKAIERFMG